MPEIKLSFSTSIKMEYKLIKIIIIYKFIKYNVFSIN